MQRSDSGLMVSNAHFAQRLKKTTDKAACACMVRISAGEMLCGPSDIEPRQLRRNLCAFPHPYRIFSQELNNRVYTGALLKKCL